MGPTASGKTDLAIHIAAQLDCDVISVDSALIYRGMDIGTAKPDKSVLAQTPHALIDIRDPSEAYSVAEFVADVQACIQQSLANRRIPLLVGGTMMYFNALQRGLSALPGADQQVREMLLAEAEANGWDVLHQRLQQIDPASATRIKPTDTQRLQRALEVFQLTGKTLSEHFQRGTMPNHDYRFINIGLMPSDREWLHKRIAKRFDIMLEQDFLGEMQALFARDDLSLDLPSMRCVGYRQGWEYLQGNYDKATFREKAIVATRQLAKRQMTWLRSWAAITLLNCPEDDLAEKCLSIIRTELQKQ